MLEVADGLSSPLCILPLEPAMQFLPDGLRLVADIQVQGGDGPCHRLLGNGRPCLVQHGKEQLRYSEIKGVIDIHSSSSCLAIKRVSEPCAWCRSHFLVWRIPDTSQASHLYIVERYASSIAHTRSEELSEQSQSNHSPIGGCSLKRLHCFWPHRACSWHDR